MSVPDEGLIQKRFMNSNFDIYDFISDQTLLKYRDAFKPALV